VLADVQIHEMSIYQTLTIHYQQHIREKLKTNFTSNQNPKTIQLQSKIRLENRLA